MSESAPQSSSCIAWSALSARIAEELGIDHAKGRLDELAVRMVAAAPSLGFANVDDCVRSLLATPWSSHQIKQLAHHLSVPETYFYRELPIMRALREHVLPALLSRRRVEGRRLRVWTAGCCTGEEPYSIAILLHELLKDIGQWDIEIRATDLDVHALSRASKGEYAEWSFRDFPAQLRAKYFTPVSGRRYRIAPRLRSLVQFEFHNLADPLAFLGSAAGYDLILCRNVLLYFASSKAQTALGGLADALADDGWLVVGSVELALVGDAALTAVAFEDCVLHRRSDAMPLAAPSVSMLPLNAEAAPVEVLPVARSIKSSPPAPGNRSRPSNRPGPRRPDQSTRMSHDALAEKLESPSDGEATDAGSAALLATQARISADAGEWAGAREQCLSALRLTPEVGALHEILAVCLHHLDEPTRAIASLRQALLLDPQQWSAHYWLGQWLGQSGRSRSATRHLRSALALLERQTADGVLPEVGGLSPSLVQASIRATLSTQGAP